MKLKEDFNISQLKIGDILFDKFHLKSIKGRLSFGDIDGRGQYMHIDFIHDINYNNDRYTSIEFRAFTLDWEFKYRDLVQTVLIETKQADRIYLVEFESSAEEAKMRLAIHGQS